MNTFFEKLTGGAAKSAPHAEEPYVITARETTRSSPPIMNNRKSPVQNPTPVRIQAEEEQVEEEANAREVLAKVRLAESSREGLLLLDRELEQRK